MWFRHLFCAKKPLPRSHPNATKRKKRWLDLFRSVKSKGVSTAPPFSQAYGSSGTVSHAATMAVPLRRITSGNDGVRLTAAVKIQSVFRAYLSRRALRALKGVVKVQALARGYFVRKRTSDALTRMQALIKAQTRARVQRVHNSQSPLSSSKSFSQFKDSPLIERSICKLEAKRVKLDSSPLLKRCASNSNIPRTKQHPSPNTPHQWIQTPSSHKTLEIHTPNTFFSTPNQTPNSRSQKQTFSLSSHESNDESIMYSALNSPQVFSMSSRLSCSARKTFDGLPNYMANTESWRAKVRSASVPKKGGGGNRSIRDWNGEHMGSFCSNSFDDMVSFL